MDLAGVEIINNGRAHVYATARGVPVTCEPCPEIAGAVGDLPYRDPVTDDAPWYDPQIPQSAGVLGVMGLAVAGFDRGTTERAPVQLVGDGAALGVLRRTHREIGYTVLMIAISDCALSYGLEWLSAALLGGACDGGACAGDQLCMFSCCPTGSDTELRHVYDVGLLDSPQVTQTQRLSNGIILATITFALAAGNPFVFREPLAASTSWVDLGGGVVADLDPDAVYDLCQPPPPCLDDPTCPPPPLPPLPPMPISPCYPTGVDTFKGSVISLGVLDQPQWLETVPVVEVQTGASEMRRLVIRGWANPQGIPCADVTDPCSACWHITIPYLPPGSVLTVDGRTQRAVVECPSEIGTSTAAPTLYGPEGSSFEWPSFTCPSGFCVEVLSLESSTAPDARARVQLVPRSDMG